MPLQDDDINKDSSSECYNGGNDHVMITEHQ